MSDKYTFFGKDQSGAKLFEIDFPTLPQEDLTPQPDTDHQVYGSSYFGPGDRVGYHTSYGFWLHEDPDHHDYIETARFVIQRVEQPNHPLQINDKGMRELHPQGREPYPYEKEAPPVREPTRTDSDEEARTILLIHDRKNASNSKMRKGQVLQSFVIPEPLVEDCTWFYQGGGEWVLDRDSVGPIARIILTTVVPRYSVIVPGMGNNRYLEEQWEAIKNDTLPNWYP